MATAQNNFPGSYNTGSSLNNSQATGSNDPAGDHNALANAHMSVEAKVGYGASLPNTNNGDVFTILDKTTGKTGWQTFGTSTSSAPPNAPMGMNVGNDQQGGGTYKTTQNQSDLTLLSSKLVQKRVRIALPSYNNSAGIANMRQLALAYKAAGYFVSYGVTGNQAIANQNATTYAAWKAQVPTEAAWASSNNMDRFYIGNEEDWQAQINQFGTITGDQVRSDVLSLATSLKSSYPSMQIVYSSAQGTVSQWGALNVTGSSLDKLGFNMYDTLANFPNNINYFMSQIGSKYFVSEWASNYGYAEMVTNRGYTDALYNQDIAQRYAYLVSKGLESYFFALRYGDNTVTPGNWNILDNNNNFVANTGNVAFGVGIPNPPLYLPSAGGTVTGTVDIVQQTNANGLQVDMFTGFPAISVQSHGVDAIVNFNADAGKGVSLNLNNSTLNDYAQIVGGGTDRGWKIGNYGDQFGAFSIYLKQAGGSYQPKALFNNDGTLRIYGLTGTGTRMVTVSSTGILSSSSLPGTAPPAAISAATTLTTSSAETQFATASSGAYNVTLPAASTSTGYTFLIKKIDSSANAVTVKGAGTDTIDGSNTYALSAQYKFVRVKCDGTSWYITGSN